ncbi:MAG: hypothetical protein LBR39_07960 [Coriobacteriales bacterium]|nr:hypothetical protein [Coriobacteriales bacterium]
MQTVRDLLRRQVLLPAVLLSAILSASSTIVLPILIANLLNGFEAKTALLFAATSLAVLIELTTISNAPALPALCLEQP